MRGLRRSGASFKSHHSGGPHLPSTVVGSLEFEIAPDALHKVNVSGAPPYAVRLPDAGVDRRSDGLRVSPVWCPTLRRAIARAGFAGIDLDGSPTRHWRSVVASLARGLPSF